MYSHTWSTPPSPFNPPGFKSGGPSHGSILTPSELTHKGSGGLRYEPGTDPRYDPTQLERRPGDYHLCPRPTPSVLVLLEGPEVPLQDHLRRCRHNVGTMIPPTLTKIVVVSINSPTHRTCKTGPPPSGVVVTDIRPLKQGPRTLLRTDGVTSVTSLTVTKHEVGTVVVDGNHH